MEKFIPYEKLSKKAKRERDKKDRVTWGALNPVTRRPQNPKAYKRKKLRPIDYDGTRLYLYNIGSTDCDLSMDLLIV